MTNHLEPGPHMEPHQVVAYLEDRLDRTRRAAVERHLAECDTCTAEVAAVIRLRRPARPSARWPVLVAAAATIAVVLLGHRGDPHVHSTPPRERGGPGSATLALVAPTADAQLRATPVFAWHPLPEATTYRVTITRADGDSVWSASVNDTTARPPEGLLSPAGGEYYWFVDALLADGSSVPAPVQRFRLGP